MEQRIVATTQHSYTPPDGFVPNEETAVHIAQAVLAPVLGVAQFEALASLNAELVNEVWSVTDDGSLGGVTTVEIAKSDARVLRVIAPVEDGEPRELAEVPYGLIPDSTTAIAVADVLLCAVYGAEQIAQERPLVLSESDGIWIVKGRLPEGNVGGVALVELARSDGKVIRMTHGK